MDIGELDPIGIYAAVLSTFIAVRDFIVWMRSRSQLKIDTFFVPDRVIDGVFYRGYFSFSIINRAQQEATVSAVFIIWIKRPLFGMVESFIWCKLPTFHKIGRRLWPGFLGSFQERHMLPIIMGPIDPLKPGGRWSWISSAEKYEGLDVSRGGAYVISVQETMRDRPYVKRIV